MKFIDANNHTGRTSNSQYTSDSKYDEMSSVVKEQLSTHKYAKMTYKQQKTAQQHSNHVTSAYVSSEYTSNQTVPHDIICLISKHAFDPLSYCNNNYISIQSSQFKNADLFIIPTKFCKPSKYLKALIELKDTKAILINDMKPEILKLFVEYLADAHYKECLFETLSKRPCVDVCQGKFDFPFIETLKENTLLDLLSAARNMKSNSLVQMVRERIDILKGIRNGPRHSSMVQSLLNSHFDRGYT